MKKIKQKLMLLLTSFTFILTSCKNVEDPSSNSSNSANNSQENSSIKYDDINFEESLPEIEVKKEKFAPTEIGSSDEQPIDIDVTKTGSEKLSTYTDVNANYSITALSKGTFLSASTIKSDYVRIEDQTGSPVDAQISSGNDNSTFLITSANGYTPGETYTVSLKDNAPLIFEGKNENVRSITFTVKKDNTNNVSYKEKIKHLSSTLIVSIDDSNIENQSMIVNSNLNAVKDDIICFDFEDANDNVFIKFKSQESYNLDKYKVYYSTPDPQDIFNTLEIHQNEEQINMEENFHLNDENAIRQSILKSDFVKEYAAAVAYTYNFASGWIDFWKSAKVSVSFYVDSLNINFKVGVKFKHKFEDSDFVLTALLTFEYKRALSIAADAKIKTVAGIVPYVSMNCTAIATDNVTVQLLITLVKSYWDPDRYKKIEENPDNLKWDDAKKAVSDMNKNISDDKAKQNEAMGTGVTGSTLSISLGYLSVQLGQVPITVDIELFFCIDISTTIGLAAGYSWSQKQVFVQYSNSNKKETKGSSSPEITRASTLSADFYGTFYLECYYKLEINVFITGLKKLFRIAISFDGGLYLNISGYGGFTYDFIKGEFSGQAGATLDYGLFFRITLSVYLFSLHSLNYKLYNVSISLVKLGDSERILSLASDAVVNIHKKETDISSTDALNFNIFDGNGFKTITKNYKYNAKRSIVSGLIVKNPVFENVFSSFAVEDSNGNLKFENGNLIVSESSPRSFNATLVVKVKSLSSSKDTEYRIPIAYVEEGAHILTIDGDTTNPYYYKAGDVVSLPIPKQKEGYRFIGYSLDDGKTLIDLQNKFLMLDKDINITSVYVENKEFTVTYYDGFGNKVGEEKVLNHNSAKGIPANERDKNMQGYLFMNWDVDLSCITSDIETYGIYIQVGER